MNLLRLHEDPSKPHKIVRYTYLLSLTTKVALFTPLNTTIPAEGPETETEAFSYQPKRTLGSTTVSAIPFKIPGSAVPNSHATLTRKLGSKPTTANPQPFTFPRSPAKLLEARKLALNCWVQAPELDSQACRSKLA